MKLSNGHYIADNIFGYLEEEADMSSIFQRLLVIKQIPSDKSRGRGRGTRKKFDRDVRVTVLGLKFDNLLFFGLLKMRVIFR